MVSPFSCNSTYTKDLPAWQYETMASESFWTQASGICTIIGLLLGTIISLTTLYFAIISLKKMQHIHVRLSTTTLDDHPPPYTDPLPPPNQEKASSKARKADLTPMDDSNESASDLRERPQRGCLGQKRWFIVLLLVLFSFTGGIIALAANIPNIRKLRFVYTPL